jgi:hypothetical protein
MLWPGFFNDAFHGFANSANSFYFEIRRPAFPSRTFHKRIFVGIRYWTGLAPAKVAYITAKEFLIAHLPTPRMNCFKNDHCNKDDAGPDCKHG